MITAITLYITGLLAAYWMLRVSHQAEKETYTKGAMVLTCLLSVLSWLIVLIMLVSAWVEKINATGYWSRPLKEEKQNTETKPESK
jgi:heme/copper-type cytochrome/quinol oxidase subunit 2